MSSAFLTPTIVRNLIVGRYLASSCPRQLIRGSGLRSPVVVLPCPLLALSFGYRRPSDHVRPLWRSDTISLNGDNGRRADIGQTDS